MDKNNRKDKGNPLKKYAALSGIAFQMGATIFVCAYAGKKLDEYFQYERKWFTMGLVIFGVVASLYIVIKQLERINKS
ncbi:AtpZ/AtpI family protein [Aquimarina brevivitae]|uniref:Putative F0F1-ATPase subunit (Ca2+/Mg2+ transporter) n=1 Tax=Aquimarina brevivitae TaxID=323412 RepID=A0A4Q7PHJ1_9FLAO|nr:AtpZ/AtpI family protein [Aquimarina brevivitae]RZS99260.1 putative F0F1-ATPase subunit (Ca2+/Mg2+ transporter) [Aquimarina brevivitae]